MADQEVVTQALPDLPGSLTFDEAKATVAAFGYKFALVPADKPSPPIGFAKQKGQ